MQQLPAQNEITDLSNNLLFTAQRLKSVIEDLTSKELEIENLQSQEDTLQKQSDLIEVSREIYKKAVEEVYANSIGRIEETINDALKFIFYDKMYSIEILIGDNRGKIVEFLLYDNGFSPPRIMSMKHGIGNGVRNVVSFIYTSFYLISKGNAPIIFADEAYHGISESYLERFFTFVRSLCKARGIAFILITHDNRFLSYADKRYMVSEGDIVQVGQ